MRPEYLRLCVSLALLIGLLGGCSRTDSPDLNAIQQQVAKGEQLFQEKECGKCHFDETGQAMAEKPAPDLTSVFLAMDTAFVKTHLQFTELTDMPKIDLSPDEIMSLTQYVGALHSKAHANADLDHPDAICPICGADVQKSDAEANLLKVSFEGKDYYFECPDCKIVFERDPTWRSQSGYAKANM